MAYKPRTRTGMKRRGMIPGGMKVELEGEWLRLNKVIDKLPTSVLAGVISGQMSAAKKLRNIVRKYIKEGGGSLNWQGVSPGYARYKTSQGGDPDRLMWLTGLYYRSIKIFRKGNKISVGISKEAKNRRGYRVVDYASVMEYGSSARNIPARPLWKPSFKQLGGKRGIKRIILIHIGRNIAVTGYKPKFRL